MRVKILFISSGIVITTVFAPVAVFADHSDSHTLQQLQSQLSLIQQAFANLFSAKPAEPPGQAKKEPSTPSAQNQATPPAQSAMPVETEAPGQTKKDPSTSSQSDKPAPPGQSDQTKNQPKSTTPAQPGTPTKPAVPGAPTAPAERQAEIEKIKLQLKSVQTGLDALQTRVEKPVAPYQSQSIASAEKIPSFERALRLGSTGEDVTRLQKFLCELPGIYPECLLTGYLGLRTEAGLKRVQKKYGLESVGFLGPRTRALLNSLSTADCRSSSSRPCYDKQAGNTITLLGTQGGAGAFDACMGNSSESQRGESAEKTMLCYEEKFQFCFEGQSQNFVRKFEGACKAAPPVTVVYPNGGEEIVEGYNYTVGGRGYDRSKNYDIKFSGGKGKVRTMLVKESATNHSDPTDLIVGTISYTALPFPIDNFVDFSAYFDSASGVNVMPSVWKPLYICNTKPSDPWGYCALSEFVVPGRYKILVLSENDNGEVLLWDRATNKPGNWDLSDEAFTIVPHSRIKVISPNGGETFSIGSTMALSWEAKGIDNRTVGIALLRKDKSMMTWIATNVPLSSVAGSFNYAWKIPDRPDFGISDQYYIAVQEVIEGESGTSFYQPADPTQFHATDLNDAPFTIGPALVIAPSPVPVPAPTPAPIPTPSSITVLSPNGGEYVVQGFKSHIFWDASSTNPITINLLKGGALYRTLATAVRQAKFSGSTFQNLYPSAWYALVSIPADIPTGDDYTLQLVDEINQAVSDRSNGPFNIIPLYSPITVRGRFIDRYTRAPLINTFLGGAGLVSTYTNANGEFSLTATSSLLTDAVPAKSIFGTWPSCYMAQGAAMRKYPDDVYVQNNIFQPPQGAGVYIPVTTPEVQLGDMQFWPGVTFFLYSDVPVKFNISYGNTGLGNSLYKTRHTLSNAVALDYDIRAQLTDQAGMVYDSPYVKLPLSHGCAPKALSFAGGKFTWEPYALDIDPAGYNTTYSGDSNLLVGTPYVRTLPGVTAGTAPYVWSLLYGALPPGLALDGVNGVISGTPTAAGTYTVTLNVTDSNGVHAAMEWTLGVR